MTHYTGTSLSATVEITLGETKSSRRLASNIVHAITLGGFGIAYIGAAVLHESTSCALAHRLWMRFTSGGIGQVCRARRKSGRGASFRLTESLREMKLPCWFRSNC